jgi:hypothetical protein
MEQVLQGLQNILIYIDDVLIHTDTHEKHLDALEQVLMRLHQHHLKINLDKCLFGDGQMVPNSRGHQTRQSQAESDQTINTTQGRQSNSVLRGPVQFLPEPYSRLRNHGSTIVQADMPGLQISIRTST